MFRPRLIKELIIFETQIHIIWQILFLEKMQLLIEISLRVFLESRDLK